MTRSNSALYIGQPLIPARTPYSTLFLRGYTKVDHMYCNILIPMYSGSVQINNSERQYTVHTLYTDNVEITTAVFSSINVCTQHKYYFVPVDF